MAPVASQPRDLASIMGAVEEDANNHETSQKIQDEASHVCRLQEWWSEGDGPTAAARNPILATLDTGVLSEVVRAGGGYHTILTADRLDGLHRRVGNGSEPELEPLRKALSTRGGSKAQARVVGMLLFKEARALHVQCEEGGATFAPMPSQSPRPAEQAPTPAATTSTAPEEIKLDESWSTPIRYVCSDSYPENAQMALRSAPSSKSSLLATLPANTEYFATGIAGDFLQVRVQIDGASTNAYALHRIGDLVLLVPAAPQAAQQPAASPDSKSKPQDLALDEVWSTPRRYICSESYPDGAQMAVRAGPSRESNQIATVGAGADYFATGRCGDYLQIRLEIDGALTTAYVTHTIGDTVLLVPAEPEVQASSSAAPAARAAAAAVAAAEAATAAAAAEAATGSRVVALETKVAVQQRQIESLQSELAEMRAQMRAVAMAFQPMMSIA